MLMIKIELWPGGSEARKRDLAAVAIANVGGDTAVGQYRYAVSHQIESGFGPTWEGHAKFAASTLLGPVSAARGKAWKVGSIDSFSRSLGAVKLLAAVLRKAGL